MAPLTAFATRAALMDAGADRIAEALSTGLTQRGAACAALSGGSTPEPAYRALAAKTLDWPRVSFALVDERFVPAHHEASNEGMLRRALAPALAAGATLVPLMQPGAPDARDAALRADALYAPLHLDIAVMGMGADGHTASWFPGADALAAALDPTNPRTVLALTAPQAAGAAARLTLTCAAIARADRLLLLITGEDKKARLEAAIDGKDSAPVSALFAPGMPRTDVLWAA